MGIKQKVNLVFSIVIILAAVAGLAWFGWWLTNQPNSPISDTNQPAEDQTVPPSDEANEDSTDEPIFDESLEYSLDVKLANKNIVPVAGASLTGTVTVLGNGKPIAGIPTSLKPRLNVTVVGVRAFYDASFGGTLRYKTVIPEGEYLQPAYVPTFTTHFYSSRILNQDFNPRQNSEVQNFELDLAPGKVDFGYIYGGGKTGNKIVLTFATSLAGKQLTKTVDIPFAAASTIKSASFSQTVKGDFYYEVKASPASVSASKVATVKLAVVAKQRNGQADTNPFQRVRLTIWPDKLDYTEHAPVIQESAGFSPPRLVQVGNASGTGTSMVYDLKEGEINYAWNWGNRDLRFFDKVVRGDWQYLQDPRTEDRQLPTDVVLDLVDGKAEVTLLTLGRATARPKVTVVVQPADFDGLSIPIYSHRNDSNFPERPRKPEGYSFLYQEWYKDDSLKNQVYTIFELPLK